MGSHGGWLPHAARGGKRLRDYSLGLRASKHAMGCKALEVHTFLCAVMDELILYDDVDVINSVGVEMMARRCYGLEQAFLDVDDEKDWRGDRKSLKVKWGLVDEYDVLRAGAGAVAPRAEERVRKEQERRANKAKWELKSAAHSAPHDA